MTTTRHGNSVGDGASHSLPSPSSAAPCHLEPADGGFGRSTDTRLGHIEEAVGTKLQPPGRDQAPRENGHIRGETVDLVRLNAPRWKRGEGQGGQCKDGGTQHDAEGPEPPRT